MKVSGNGITLYLLDAVALLQSLPEGSVDLILTDPPWNSGGERKSTQGTYQDAYTLLEYQVLTEAWLRAAWRALKPTGTLLVWLDYRWTPYLAVWGDQLFGYECRLGEIIVESSLGNPGKVQSPKTKDQSQPEGWSSVLKEISEKLKRAPAGSAAIVASARQTNEELYLLAKLAKKLGALTDSVPRLGEGDRLLLNADRNPNSTGARLTGIAAEPMGSKLLKIAEGIRGGRIKTLIVIGEDVTRHGISAELLGKLEMLVVSDILPGETTRRAHYLLPGCAHAEKRGTFTSTKGRVQKFMKAVEPPGDARPEWEFLRELVSALSGQDGFVSIEGLFNHMAAEAPAFNGLTWASLGETGVTVRI